MSKTIRNADFEKYDSDNPERTDAGCAEAMGVDHEDYMEEIFSDPLLDVIAGLEAGETPHGEASRQCIAEYLKKYRLLGVVECNTCGNVNYEGDQHCSQCGTNLLKQTKMKLSAV